MREVEEAKKAIDAVFSDTSVAPEDTYIALAELRDQIVECVRALVDDGVEDEQGIL